MNEINENKVRLESNHQLDSDESLFSSIHHHKLRPFHSTEQYSTLSSINNLNEHFTINGQLPHSKNNKLLIVDCTSDDTNKINNLEYRPTDSTINHLNSPQSSTYQLELWRETDEQSVLLVTKKTTQNPRFIINYSLFDEWLDQEFVYSIYILAYNNQGKSDHLLKITFSQPEQLLQEQQNKKHHFFELIPFSVVFNDQNSTHNQSKLFKSSNFTRPFTLLSALYKGKILF